MFMKEGNAKIKTGACRYHARAEVTGRSPESQIREVFGAGTEGLAC